MKKTVHALFTVLTFLFGMFQVQSTFAALPIQKADLPTGAKLFFVAARTIPMVNIGIDFPGGSAYDPLHKYGVSEFTAELMDKGSKIQGVEKNEAYIADSISDLGSMVNFHASNEIGSVRIKTLSKAEVLNSVINQVSDMLAYPTFNPKILEREKARTRSSLLESKTKPEFLLGEQFKKMIYRDHPLGNEETIETIAKIEVADLKKFHQMYYRANQMNVIIVGDVDFNQAIEIGTRLTKNLPTGPIVNTTLPSLMALAVADQATREVKIAHPSAQAHIQMGITSPPRKDPDYFPLLVGNYILGGGGFVSRLMNEIREKRGLAYSVSSYFYPAKNSGFFTASLQTRKDQSNEAATLLKDTIAQFVEKGPTDEEMLAAKNNLINGFPLRIDSNNKLLENLSAIAWLDLPLDTLDTWTEHVQEITKENVQAAFKKHLLMDRMVTVTVGGK
jgi:zinc protease